ncbi:MAG: hypothetical protein J6R40_05055 [Clostridia bacterium]|nr:hypothetical protein [Clostridia bacterium]
MRLRERIARVMAGRYGPDKLYQSTIWCCLILVIVSAFLRRFPLAYFIVTGVETLLFVWAMWRFFSKNIAKRQRENYRFLQFFAGVRKWFRLQKSKRRDRKVAVYRKCPHCKATLRLPKQKGKHSARCPRCRTLFEVKIR